MQNFEILEEKKSYANKWSLLTPFIWLFSFESLFVLFINAGRYKGDPRFEWVPFDLTALFFTASILSGAIVFARSRRTGHLLQAKPIIISFLAFLAYAFLSLLWTSSSVYASEKIFYLATLLAWSLFGSVLVISQSRERLIRFLGLLVVFGLWVSYETLTAAMQADKVGFTTALGSNYLGIGRVLGVASIVLMYVVIFGRSFLVRSSALFFGGFFTYQVLGAGGRGPLLAVILSLFIPVLFGIRFTLKRGPIVERYVYFFFGVLLLGAFAAWYYISVGGSFTTMDRFILLFGSDIGASASTRAYYYETSFDLWQNNPIFGYGIGSWPVQMGFSDARDYPHNILYEVGVELGAIGLFLLANLFVQAGRLFGPLSRIRTEPVRMLIASLFVNAFCNAWVSGDLNDNRFLFVVLGLAAMRDSFLQEPPVSES